MQSDAKTVQEYLDSLPEDRKRQISDTRDVILKNLDKGFQEVMNWGMICYEIPLEVFPDTYNKKPLLYAALASQKNHMAVYMSGIYMDENLLKKFHLKSAPKIALSGLPSFCSMALKKMMGFR